MKQATLFDHPTEAKKLEHPYKYSQYWCRNGEAWHCNSLFTGYNDGSDVTEPRLLADVPTDRINRQIWCETIEDVKAVMDHTKTVPHTYTICTRISTDYLCQIEGFHKNED